MRYDYILGFIRHLGHISVCPKVGTLIYLKQRVYYTVFVKYDFDIHQNAYMPIQEIQNHGKLRPQGFTLRDSLLCLQQKCLTERGTNTLNTVIMMNNNIIDCKLNSLVQVQCVQTV